MGKADVETNKAIEDGRYVIEATLDWLKVVDTISYNKPDTFELPEEDARSLARSLLPAVEEFYSHEENREAFEKWKKERDKKDGK